MDLSEHWDQAYAARPPREVSWYEADPATSLEFIGAVAPRPDAAIVDVGGGASLLVDRLLDQGFTDLAVLDVSVRALSIARDRLQERRGSVRWIEGDVRQDVLGPDSVDLWHDRAVFHFLTNPDDRRAYVEHLSRALRTGGHAIIATFALDGPARCSGLDVSRYSAATLADTLGERFELLRSMERTHATPAAREQRFTYALFRKRRVRPG